MGTPPSGRDQLAYRLGFTGLQAPRPQPRVSDGERGFWKPTIDMPAASVRRQSPRPPVQWVDRRVWLETGLIWSGHADPDSQPSSVFDECARAYNPETTVQWMRWKTGLCDFVLLSFLVWVPTRSRPDQLTCRRGLHGVADSRPPGLCLKTGFRRNVHFEFLTV